MKCGILWRFCKDRSESGKNMARLIQKTSDIRIQNKRKIIQCLLSCDRLTKKQIGEKTGLSFSTVSNLTSQLMEKHIIDIPCYQDSEGGRSPGLLAVDGESRFFTAIHIYHKSMLQVQVLSLKKGVMLTFAQTVRPPFNANAIYNACVLGVRRCELEVPGYAAKNLGIGIALPGIVETSSGLLINSTIKELEHQPVLEKLRGLFPYPVYGENESNLLALAVSYNPQKPSQKKDTIYLHMDEGLGIGIICNGELVRGSHGLGSEINTIPLCFDMDKSVTLEEKMVFPDYLRKYREKMGDLSLSESVFLRDAQTILTSEVRDILREKGLLIGRLIAVLDALFDPVAFYLGGKVSLLFNSLRPFIQEAYYRLATIRKDKPLVLYPCEDYQQQLMTGCADLVFDHWDFS